MKIQKQIDVRLVRKGPVSSLRVVQYDTGVQLVFNVLDFDLPSGTTATLYVRKKSGKFVYQEKGITVSGNTVTVDLENQALTEHGEAFYQLRFLNGSDVISTFSSSMYVERSLADADADESTTVIAAFEAKTAEQIAQIEAAAQEQIEQIQNMFNTYATKNEAAYAIKGNLSGAVVSAGDVATMEHNPVVKVHGKNLFDVSKLSSITEKLTNNNDGTLTIAANQYAVPTGKKLNELCPSLKAGDVCTLSFVSTSAYTKYVWLNGANVMLYNGAYTFTDEMLSSELYLYGLRDTDEGYGSICTISNIQIEKGSVATDYEPYIDPATVTVTRCGKNLIPYPFKETTVTKKGVTFTDNKDGTLTVNGTAEATVSFIFFEGNMPVDGAYTLSGLSGGSGSTYYVQPLCSDKAHPGLSDASKSYKWDGLALNRLQLNVVAGTVVSNLRVSVMLEKSNAATAFEPYNGAEYTPESDGTVSGITSLSPNMTILTDTEGAIVECEYNVDTKTYIKNMLSGASTTRITDVELLASAWEDTELPYLYAQVINIPGTTKFSQVNLNPSVEQMSIFYEKNLSFITENEDGVVTVYAIGQKPMNDYVIQTAIREVSA